MVSFVFFSFTVHLFHNIPICSIRGTFFFTVHSFYEYIQSNQWNMHEHKKSFQQELTFFLQCTSLFLLVSICSQLNKVYGCTMRTYGSVCAMDVCCVRLLLSEQCTVNDVHTQTMRKQHTITNFYYSDSIIRNRINFGTFSNGFGILI